MFESRRNKIILAVILVAVAAAVLIFLASLEKNQNVCSTCDGGSVSSGDGYITFGDYTNGEYGDEAEAWASKCDYRGKPNRVSSVTIRIEVLQATGKWKTVDETGWNLKGSGGGVFYIDYKASEGGSVIRDKGKIKVHLDSVDVSGMQSLGHTSLAGTNILLKGQRRALAMFLFDEDKGKAEKIPDAVDRYDDTASLQKCKKAVAITLTLNREKHY